MLLSIPSMLLTIIVLVVAATAQPPPRLPPPPPSNINYSTRRIPTSNINYSPENVQVLNYENDNLGGGNYKFAFEQSDGTRHQQEGALQRGDADKEDFLVLSGTYSWVGPDGVTYTVTYLADEDGYKPRLEQGAGGAIPEALLARTNN